MAWKHHITYYLHISLCFFLMSSTNVFVFYSSRNYPGPFSGWRHYRWLFTVFTEQARKIQVSVLYLWLNAPSFDFFSLSLLCSLTVCLFFMCSYVETYDLQQPSDDIQYVLKRIAVKLGKRQRVKAITGVGKGMLILQIHLLHTILLNLYYSD